MPNLDPQAVADLERTLSDPRTAALYREIIVERASEAEKRLAPEPRAVSSTTIAHLPRLMRARAIVSYLSAGLSAVSVAALFSDHLLGILTIGIVTLGSGIAGYALLLGEIFAGAGWHEQVEYEAAGEHWRGYKFVPSLRHFRSLVAVLAAAGAGIWLGFASIYTFLSRHGPASFSEPVAGVTAIYFSVITFATVGFGDISPKSQFARAVVTLEVLVAFFVGALVLGTVTAWVLSQRQRAMEATEAAMRKTVERREATLKEAGLGVYGDPATLLKEVRERARERGIEIAPPSA